MTEHRLVDDGAPHRWNNHGFADVNMKSTDVFEFLKGIDDAVDIPGEVIDNRPDVVGVSLIVIVLAQALSIAHLWLTLRPWTKGHLRSHFGCAGVARGSGPAPSLGIYGDHGTQFLLEQDEQASELKDEEFGT